MWTVYTKIADLSIKIDTTYSINHICKEYLIDSCVPDLSISINKSEIEELKNAIPKNEQLYSSYYESVAVYKKICMQMWKFHGMLFHAAVIETGGRGIAFAAKSGTGKTTHLKLWQQFLGNKLKIVNGDKPIVRIIDEVPIAYGTPWCGKERFGNNSSVKLTDICFIERSETNSIEKIYCEAVFNRIFNQILLPTDAEACSVTFDILNKMLSKCNLWLIKCNMNLDAAEVAYSEIFKGDKNDSNL